MYLTGFADEATDDIKGQIMATRLLGWKNIEARTINGKTIAQLSEKEFEVVEQELKKANIKINCLASTIANWQKTVLDPLEDDLREARKLIPRMKKLNIPMVRIMSYAPLRNEQGNILDNQEEDEVFRRLNIISRMFQEEGIIPVHENCMTYGGMSWQNTQNLLTNVPSLKLVFDTGNPIVLAVETHKLKHCVLERVSWDFYQQVREHIIYVHIKDVIFNQKSNKLIYTYPGEGQANIRKILRDLISHGYEGGLSIEPHMEVVFHDPSRQSTDQARLKNYIQYGNRLMKILEEISDYSK